MYKMYWLILVNHSWKHSMLRAVFIKYLGEFQALLSLNTCIYRIFSEYEHRSFTYYFENYVFRKKKKEEK